MIGTILKANITEGPKTDLIHIKTVTKCRKNNNFNDFFFHLGMFSKKALKLPECPVLAF